MFDVDSHFQPARRAPTLASAHNTCCTSFFLDIISQPTAAPAGTLPPLVQAPLVASGPRNVALVVTPTGRGLVLDLAEGGEEEEADGEEGGQEGDLDMGGQE